MIKNLLFYFYPDFSDFRYSHKRQMNNSSGSIATSLIQCLRNYRFDTLQLKSLQIRKSKASVRGQIVILLMEYSMRVDLAILKHFLKFRNKYKALILGMK